MTNFLIIYKHGDSYASWLSEQLTLAGNEVTQKTIEEWDEVKFDIKEMNLDAIVFNARPYDNNFDTRVIEEVAKEYKRDIKFVVYDEHFGNAAEHAFAMAIKPFKRLVYIKSAMNIEYVMRNFESVK